MSRRELCSPATLAAAALGGSSRREQAPLTIHEMSGGLQMGARRY